MSRRKFTNIYVNPDLTEAQRSFDKQLRVECKQKNDPLNLKVNWGTARHYYAIRNNAVIRIDQ